MYKFQLKHYNLCILLIYIFIFCFSWVTKPIVVTAFDVFGYYLYLPAQFIYKDLFFWKTDALNHVTAVYNRLHELSGQNIPSLYATPIGGHVVKYTMGWSICYLPFFLAGHWYAYFAGYVQDGFSVPYQNALIIGAAFYTILSVWMLSRILLKFFKPLTALITIILLVWGTNFFIHTTFRSAGLLTHTVLFAFCSLFIWLVIKLKETDKSRYIILATFVIGIISLIRFTELTIVIWAILYLFGVKNMPKNIGQHLLQKKWTYVLASLILGSIIYLQLAYWKGVSGSYIYDSYSYDGWEGFDFLYPHIAECLFSFRKGWFIYTPLVLLALIPLFFNALKKNAFAIAGIIYLLVNVYIVGSWSNWWYADSYGQRAMIPSLSILAIGWAQGIEYVLNENRRRIQQKFLILITSILFIYTQFKVYQYITGIVSSKTMTYTYFIKSFFLTKRNLSLEDEYLLIDRFGKYKSALPPLSMIKTKPIKPFVGIKEVSGSDSLYVSPQMDFCLGNDYKFEELTQQKCAWIKVSAQVQLINNTPFNSAGISLGSFFNKKPYNYQCASFKNYNPTKNKWTKVEFIYLLIEPRRPWDEVRINVWNPNKEAFYIKDYKLELVELKRDRN